MGPASAASRRGALCADAVVLGERMEQTRSLEMAEIADSTSSLPERAHEMLQRLRRRVRFDAAWLALADPMSSSYSPLASSDLDESTLQYLSGPKMARDIEVT